MLVKNDVRSRNVDMNIRPVAHDGNLPRSANGKLRGRGGDFAVLNNTFECL
jgi:hypothetical protein